MRYTYDDEADALYVHLREENHASVARSVVVDEGRVMDLDRQGDPVGIEILGASGGVHLSDLVDRFRLQDWTVHLRQLEATQFRPAVSA
jgi:uncharacterized protein YuzE